ncbi:MAG: HD domain-containing protein [Desulfobacterales bacterium]
MKPVFEKIRCLAKPYLHTRQNEVHTAISTEIAYKLIKAEGGEEDIVIPAIILHDVGWQKIPVSLQSMAFGPKATKLRLNRMHEVEGAKIAKEILEKINYDPDKTDRITRIIEGHDSREKAISINDMIVKDADKLWRYSKSGFYIDIERFEETVDEGLNRLRKNLSNWFYTETAKAMAAAMVKNREGEKVS